MTVSTITVEPGYKGIVSAVTDARYDQRASVKLRTANGRVPGSTTFVGKGKNVPLAQETNSSSDTWCFGPFKEPVSIDVTIEHCEEGGNFCPSKVLDPITVSKCADAVNPVDYRLSTILSEDGVDNDFTDCTVTVAQYL